MHSAKTNSGVTVHKMIKTSQTVLQPLYTGWPKKNRTLYTLVHNLAKY